MGDTAAVTEAVVMAVEAAMAAVSEARPAIPAVASVICQEIAHKVKNVTIVSK